MRGGEDCVYVSQLPFDPTQPWIDRPEITVTGVRNFQMLDDEHSLADEAYPLPITGTFAGFARQGVFRQHFYAEGNAVRNQTLFVENYTRLTMIVTDGEGEEYERFYGYACGGATLSSQDGVLTVNECAQLCEANDNCACFDYQAYYHSVLRGRCRLAEAGRFTAYPVRNALQPGANMGLLQTETEDGAPVVGGVPVPFEAFASSYVTLSDTHTCQAPSQSMGVIVNSAETCASLCAPRSGCSFFSFNPFTLTCLQVRTTSATVWRGWCARTMGFTSFPFPRGAGAYRLPARAHRARVSQ